MSSDVRADCRVGIDSLEYECSRDTRALTSSRTAPERAEEEAQLIMVRLLRECLERRSIRSRA